MRKIPNVICVNCKYKGEITLFIVDLETILICPKCGNRCIKEIFNA